MRIHITYIYIYIYIYKYILLISLLHVSNKLLLQCCHIIMTNKSVSVISIGKVNSPFLYTMSLHPPTPLLHWHVKNSSVVHVFLFATGTMMIGSCWCHRSLMTFKVKRWTRRKKSSYKYNIYIYMYILLLVKCKWFPLPVINYILYLYI